MLKFMPLKLQFSTLKFRVGIVLTVVLTRFGPFLSFRRIAVQARRAIQAKDTARFELR